MELIRDLGQRFLQDSTAGPTRVGGSDRDSDSGRVLGM